MGNVFFFFHSPQLMDCSCPNKFEISFVPRAVGTSLLRGSLNRVEPTRGKPSKERSLQLHVSTATKAEAEVPFDGDNTS